MKRLTYTFTQLIRMAFSPAELVKKEGTFKNSISALHLPTQITTDGIDEAIDAGGNRNRSYSE